MVGRMLGRGPEQLYFGLDTNTTAERTRSTSTARCNDSAYHHHPNSRCHNCFPNLVFQTRRPSDTISQHLWYSSSSNSHLPHSSGTRSPHTSLRSSSSLTSRYKHANSPFPLLPRSPRRSLHQRYRQVGLRLRSPNTRRTSRRRPT